jgi:hypothetical protein
MPLQTLLWANLRKDRILSAELFTLQAYRLDIRVDMRRCQCSKATILA